MQGGIDSFYMNNFSFVFESGSNTTSMTASELAMRKQIFQENLNAVYNQTNATELTYTVSVVASMHYLSRVSVAFLRGHSVYVARMWRS